MVGGLAHMDFFPFPLLIFSSDVLFLFLFQKRVLGTFFPPIRRQVVEVKKTISA